jgi:hypothetical protein
MIESNLAQSRKVAKAVFFAPLRLLREMKI